MGTIYAQAGVGPLARGTEHTLYGPDLTIGFDKRMGWLSLTAGVGYAAVAPFRLYSTMPVLDIGLGGTFGAARGGPSACRRGGPDGR